MKFIVSIMFFLSMVITQGFCEEGKVINLEFPQEKDHQIEIFLQKSQHSQAPLIIFLYGAGSNEIPGISSCIQHWANKGYSCAAISSPGFGNTTGKRDFCGLFTMNVLNYAIDCIKQELNVADFGMIGFGYTQSFLFIKIYGEKYLSI